MFVLLPVFVSAEEGIEGARSAQLLTSIILYDISNPLFSAPETPTATKHCAEL